MMKYKRWHPVSHDINADPEMWVLRKEVGEKSLSIWLEILSIADRNNGELSGDYQELIRSVAGRCQSTVRTVSAVYDYALSHLWLVYEPTLRVRNFWLYHRNREPNSRQNGGELHTPPLPNLTKPNQTNIIGDEKPSQKRKTSSTPAAIETIREITLRFPPKHLWPELEKRSDGLEKERLKDAFGAWGIRGYSPTNYNWIDWARNGIPAAPGAQRNGVLPVPCAICSSKDPGVRARHSLSFASEDELKQHFYLTYGPDEGQHRYQEQLAWWKTKRSIQEMHHDI